MKYWLAFNKISDARISRFGDSNLLFQRIYNGTQSGLKYCTDGVDLMTYIVVVRPLSTSVCGCARSLEEHLYHFFHGLMQAFAYSMRLWIVTCTQVIFYSKNLEKAGKGIPCRLATVVMDNLYWSWILSKLFLFNFWYNESLALQSISTNSKMFVVMSMHFSAQN